MEHEKMRELYLLWLATEENKSIIIMGDCND